MLAAGLGPVPGPGKALGVKSSGTEAGTSSRDAHAGGCPASGTEASEHRAGSSQATEERSPQTGRSPGPPGGRGVLPGSGGLCHARPQAFTRS